MLSGIFHPVDDVRHELNRMRDRLETIGSRLQPRLHAVADDASELGDQATRRMRHEAARVSTAVQDQPLVALGLALVAGFIIASMVKRG